ncbi:hypothetical protein K466DRAFT_652758 [Polyporus arcularius HHB13444]|uniref:Uncharacterized protein n=1 Tax=Polyporus arcularius HHB13444 TaxID=1314778 RepID=A0A5C3PGQ2_9APHY|nr:hypothetical protein K466DRAFT_652758 [Polyporus arcularius HHB13444]
MSALIEQYKAKTPPSPQIIEAYVQRIASYMNLFTEDSHYASKDPTARDSALGAIQQNPQTANDFSPYSVVPLGSDPDPYLAKADAEIERISSKSTLTMADRALRLHWAFSAQLVFTEYKVYLAYADWPDVFDKIDTRLDVVHHTWLRDFLARDGIHMDPFQGHPLLGHLSTPTVTPPSRHPSSSTSTTKLHAAQVEALLKNPRDLLNAQFKSATLDGTFNWELASFTQDRSGIQYSIRLIDQPDLIPMDVDSMRTLLSESVAVA